MATANLTTVDRPHVGQALRQFRINYANNSRVLNALNRAALNLKASPWQFDGEELVIESATQVGTVRYHVKYDVCDCQAASHSRSCWHRAAYRLLKKATEIAQQPQRPRHTTEDFARIQREAAELV